MNVAQLNIDDVELVVVLLDAPVEAPFDTGTLEQKRLRHATLQHRAASAGLAGPVAVVWQDAQGRTRFLAPPEQHAFFQIVSYAQLRAQVNRTLQVP